MRAISMRLILAISYFCFMGANSLFATAIIDDPCNAISLSATEACTFTTYNNNSATSSTGVTAPGCGNYAGGDLWFQVEMPNNGFHLKVDFQAGTLTDLAVAVYEGSACTGLTLVSCDASSGIGNMPSITIDDGCVFENANETFWIRVWDEGGDETGDFGICVSAVTPAVAGNPGGCGSDIVTGDFCCDAVLLTDNFDGYCGNTGGFSASSTSINDFCAFVENNSWLAFVASEPSVEIGIEHSNCVDGFGIQAIIYETSDCSTYAMASDDCWNPGPTGNNTGTLVANNLTPGETYYIMVDGWSGDVCDYTLSLISGVLTSSASAVDTVICAGQSTSLSADVYGIGPYTYAWSPAGSLDDASINNPVATPGITTTYMVTITSPTDVITESVEVVVDQVVPGAGGINGPNSVCENTNDVLYDANSSNSTSYTWTVSGGGTIDGSSTGSTLTVDWGTTGGTVCMTPSNECGSAAEVCINVAVVAAPEISATDPPKGCSPGFVNLAGIGISNNTGGIGIISFFNTFSDANNGVNQLSSPLVYTAGTYWVRMDNGLNCFDVTSVNATIEDPQITTADPQPVCFPGTVDLDADVFKNELNGWPGGTYTYFADSLAGVNDVNELTSSVVNASGMYWVRYETATGCFDVAGIEVKIEESPDVSPGAPLYICDSECVDLATATIPEANMATVVDTLYFLTPAFAGLGWPALAMTSSIVCDPGTYYVRFQTAAGCWDTTHIQVLSLATPTASISGGAALCASANGTLTFTMTGDGPFDVVYNNSATNTDITLTGITSPYTETVAINANTDFTIVSVSDSGSCPGTFSGTASFTTNTAPSFNISGTTSICNGGDTDITFNLTGTGPFNVVYNDGSDVTLTGISDGHTVSVSPGLNTTYAPVSVTDANGCTGTVTTGATVSLAAGITISTPIETCNNTNTEFTVTFQLTGGDASSYQVTGGGSFDFGSNTFTSNSLPTGSTYQFLVSDSNCGPIEVDGVHACNCTTAVGTMGNATKYVCEGATATMQYDNAEVLDADDVLLYVLHDSPGPNIGNVLLTNTVPTFNYDPILTYEQFYYVSVVVGSDDGTGVPDMDDPCLAISNTQSVAFFKETEVAISAPEVICEGETTQLTFNFTGTSAYNVEYEDNNGNTYNLSGVSDGHTVDVTPTGTVTYTIEQVSLTTFPFCLGEIPLPGKSVTIELSQQPTVTNLMEDCDNQNENYTVSFEIMGGVPTGYSVTGGPGNLVGNLFTSGLIPEETPYTFTVSDGVCPSFEVTGVNECDCITSIGSMSTTPLELCDDDIAYAAYNGGEVLDPDDVLGFILHDSAGAPLGNIFATSLVPEFAYMPSLSYGVTYYISAVVGNDDGTGFPVLDQALDPCLGISESQPVSFFTSTEMSIDGDANICVGETANIIFNFNTPGTFDVEYSDGTTNFTLTEISNGYGLEVTPSQTTTYSLVSVINHDSPFCPGTIAPLENMVTIDVSEGPIVSNMFFECDDQSIFYTMTFEINGGNVANYNVTGLNGILTGNTFVSEPMLGGTNYAFDVTDGGPCPTQQSGAYACLCFPDMMPVLTVEEVIGCGGESDGVVSVSAFSGTGPFVYNWSSGANGEEVSDLGVGWHVVTMTDTYGCIAIDSVYLSEPVPIAAELSFVNPLCYDANDASIAVENLNGGTGNYDISLNVLASYQNQIFTGLNAGNYVVSIEDDKGCVWSDSVLITNPDQFMVNTSDDLTIQLGDSLELEVFTNAVLDTFYWTPQLANNCDGCLSQFVHPTQETIYTLNAVSSDGCIANDQFRVIVSKDNPIYIPTAFSPNGDGINDLFSLYPSISIKNIKNFNIFTRWGAQLYQRENFLPGLEDMGWDGSFKGKEMASGVYVYFVELEYVDGSTEIVRGDVTLVR